MATCFSGGVHSDWRTCFSGGDRSDWLTCFSGGACSDWLHVSLVVPVLIG